MARTKKKAVALTAPAPEEEQIPHYETSRSEAYLNYIVGSSNTYPQDPCCRLEQYLYYLCKHKTDGNNVMIQVTEDVTLISPNPSWVVPKLTTEQVLQAYNAVVAGKSCSIVNAAGNIAYKVVLGDSLAEPSIVIQHYWLGFVDYQIHDSSDEVTITGHPITNE